MVWTGERGPSILSSCCGPKSIRKLAARENDEINDEIVNTIPIIGVAAESPTYLLPSYAYEHIQKRKFDLLARWVKPLSSVNCRWVFGVCQDSHWTAIAIDWQESTIRHYDPLPGFPKRSGDMHTVSP